MDSPHDYDFLSKREAVTFVRVILKEVLQIVREKKLHNLEEAIVVAVREAKKAERPFGSEPPAGQSIDDDS